MMMVMVVMMVMMMMMMMMVFKRYDLIITTFLFVVLNILFCFFEKV